jgi:putative Mg2+ transporter-C (MgtC) family protein
MNEWEAIVRTLAALVAGGAIGLERSYHGRAAGLRTYALVSFGSALLVAGGQFEVITGRETGEVSRIIQGIVTGIGFLGAGVIVKEGFSVRGLTTAASIWVAAAVGVVLGAGSYWMGLAATLVTLGALTILRRVEDRLPSQTFVHFEVGFHRASDMNEERLRELIREHGFTISDFTYRLNGSAQSLEYRGVMWSTSRHGLQRLERSLCALPDVLHFRMSPTRE